MNKIAEHHLVAGVPAAAKNETAAIVIERIRQSRWDTISYIYVLDGKKLAGVLSIKESFASNPSAAMKDIMKTPVIHVYPHTPQEQVAIKALRNNIKAVPVIESKTKNFLGVVPPDKIISILHEEHVDDLLKQAGIQRTLNITDVFQSGVWGLVKLRFSWLIIGLIGGMLTTFLVSSFEEILSRQVVLAFFMPVVLYMSGAVGAQTETLFIRTLALKNNPFRAYLLKEAGVGFLLAFFNSSLIFIFISLWLKSFILAASVSLAMFIGIFMAAIASILLPSIFILFKKDAALGTAPLLNALRDLMSLTIYFLVASLIIF